MIAAGVARKLVFSWLGNPGVGGLGRDPAADRGRDPGRALEVEEYSHFGMVARYTAGAMNLPFFPLRSYFETDLPMANPLIRPIESPYGDGTIYAVPPLRPDVTIVHAQRASAGGDTQVWGLLGCQKEAAFAAERVIVVVEEVVDEAVIRADPNRTIIPGLIVDAVVVEPWGAHPSYVQGAYDRDNRFYLDWDPITRDEAATQAWLREWVYGVDGRAEYIEKLGAERVASLRPRAGAVGLRRLRGRTADGDAVRYLVADVERAGRVLRRAARVQSSSRWCARVRPGPARRPDACGWRARRRRPPGRCPTGGSPAPAAGTGSSSRSTTWRHGRRDPRGRRDVPERDRHGPGGRQILSRTRTATRSSCSRRADDSQPLMILVAGPYRSGTDGDPARIAANVDAMTAVSLELCRRGHLPVMGEWFALPLIEAAERRGDAGRRTTRSSIRSPSGSWRAATPVSGSAARPRARTGWSRRPGDSARPSPRHRRGPVTERDAPSPSPR